jgi:Amidohydrolase
VRTRPSDVVREHIRFSTQPFDYVPSAALLGILESVEGIEDVICFSSDYPHWDGDEPTYIATRLPERWHAKLFYENAAKFLGFELAAGVAPVEGRPRRRFRDEANGQPNSPVTLRHPATLRPSIGRQRYRQTRVPPCRTRCPNLIPGK